MKYDGVDNLVNIEKCSEYLFDLLSTVTEYVNDYEMLFINYECVKSSCFGIL